MAKWEPVTLLAIGTQPKQSSNTRLKREDRIVLKNTRKADKRLGFFSTRFLYRTRSKGPKGVIWL